MAVAEEGQGHSLGGADFPVHATVIAFHQIPAVVGPGLHPVYFFGGVRPAYPRVTDPQRAVQRVERHAPRIAKAPGVNFRPGVQLPAQRIVGGDPVGLVARGLPDIQTQNLAGPGGIQILRLEPLLSAVA